MGWERIPWYSLTDFGVDEWHGTNAFIRDAESMNLRASAARLVRTE
jgi:hypothetical protein